MRKRNVLVGIMVGIIAISLVGIGVGDKFVIGGNWHNEPPDISLHSGYWSSIGLDSNDYPQIIHGCYLQQLLRYTKWNGTGWESENITAIDTVMIHDDYTTSAVWDTSEYVHIAHSDYSCNNLIHTFYNGTGYETETIEAIDAKFVSMTIDGFDRLHVSYQDNNLGDLKYATKSLAYADTWAIETVDSEGWGNGGYTSITIDTLKQPCISYVDLSNLPYPLKYAKKTEGSWVIETLTSGIRIGQTSIAIDSLDRRHIAFIDTTDDYLGYAFNKGSSWDITYLAVEAKGAPTIKTDTYDKPHIMFASDKYAAANYDLQYMFYDGFSWYHEWVDSSHTTLHYGTSFVLDQDKNTIHASYQNVDTIHLKYAKYNLTYMEWSKSHGIYGNVYLIPFYSAGNNTDISCSNTSFSSSTISNKTGYYEFDNLEKGNYWINASKYDYIDYNAIAEIVSGWNQTLLDNCDTVTDNGNWESDGSVTTDTAIKKETNASINITTNLPHTFWKNFTIPINASNISKSAGFFILWYYIDNSSLMSDYVTIKIGSGSYNTTPNITWDISKTYFNNNWSEIWLPLAEGTENGTVDMSSITWFDMNVAVDSSATHKIDYLRFVEYPYTLHNIYMQLDTDYEGGAGTYFPPPHLVEFRVQNIYGSPIGDVTVTAAGYETTMGSLTWLYSIFGYRNETRIHNTTMDGTTDTFGHLSFLMVEPIKYKLDFVKESEGINTTMYFYPKETQYQIILTPGTRPDMIDYVIWNLSVETINSSYSSLNITYNDDMSKTTNLCFFVKDVNKTEICNTCFPGESSVNTGYTLKKESGVSYFWGFNVSHETFGDLTQAKAVTFKSRLLNLQLENEAYYTWISIAILFAMTSLFSFTTAKFGYVMIPFMSGILYYVGWLSIPTTLLTVTIILGILLYMGKRERETNL